MASVAGPCNHAEVLEHSLKPGEPLTDGLTLVRELGEGAMGTVWLARDESSQRELAVKVLPAKLAARRDFVARFLREARATARLRSPHIVRVFGAGTTHQGLPFIAMELLDGESIEQRLERKGRLGLTETTTIVRHLCRALEVAHGQDIVHRDIKPANVFWRRTEQGPQVKLIDFGIAKDSDDLIKTGTSHKLGTPLYMAPEQLLSAKNADARSDLWSVAVLAYRCITGVVPFDANNYFDLYQAVQRGTREPASALLEGLPSAVDRWFDTALQSKADKRFQSAAQMAQALTEATIRADY